MPVAPLRPGDPERVGPHRLLGRLGQGGMGTVYLGVSPDERAVAVKVLRDGLADAEARRRFRHELDALRRVRGPHVVEVLDADVDADVPYLVTRFVPGRRLDELVADRGPLEGEALDLLAGGVADAVAVLSRSGVVHRDLTPGNVLVVDGSPQVIDLGLAVAADVTALTRSGLVVGTPGYLAPEQVLGSEVTGAVDVHAWGATTAFAGTGRPPYGTGRPEAVLYRIVHERPDLDGLPPRLRRTVEAAMAPDPLDRPSAEELLVALGGAPDPALTAPTTAVHLPRDVDATTVLGEELATVPRAAPTALLEPEPAPAVLARPGAGPVQAVATAGAALALLVALALVLPVVTPVVALLAVVLLRAAGRSAEARALRRERRGQRRSDPLVSTLGAPVHLLAGLLDTVSALPLMVLVAAPPAALVWLADPVVNGLEKLELTVATATLLAVVACLARRAHRRSRLLLRRALAAAAPSPVAGTAVVAVLLLAALLLLATAEGAAPSTWPL